MSRFAPQSLYAPVEILSRGDAEEIAKRALKNSPADETRVTINSNARADTRFALNQVTTSGENRDTSVTITAYVGGRAASVTTNRLDEASLAQAARQATEIAKLVPPNPERMPELGAQEYPSPRTRQISLPSPTERALAAKAVTEQARKAGLIATGFIESRAGANALANSKGLFAYDSSTVVTMTATVRTTDGTGSGWACSDGDSFADIDAQRVGATAVKRRSLRGIRWQSSRVATSRFSNQRQWAISFNSLLAHCRRAAQTRVARSFPSPAAATSVA